MKAWAFDEMTNVYRWLNSSIYWLYSYSFTVGRWNCTYVKQNHLLCGGKSYEALYPCLWVEIHSLCTASCSLWKLFIEKVIEMHNENRCLAYLEGQMELDWLHNCTKLHLWTNIPLLLKLLCDDVQTLSTHRWII